jgi:CMP-N,N'-diacetyllegionaminic acid synthase
MYNNLKILAIVPARKGSKRLPDKNILDLAGKPLIAWTIEAALGSVYIDHTIVSTDSDDIARISIEYGAEVPFLRPVYLANDTASSTDVILHAINYYESNGISFDIIVLLQPTSPLRSNCDIDKAIEEITKKNNAIISVCETDHPPLWANTLPGDLSMKNFIHPDIKDLRSQDFPKYYRINGAIYISYINYFKLNNGFLGDATKAFIMENQKSVDIDSILDFHLCSILLRAKNE